MRHQLSLLLSSSKGFVPDTFVHFRKYHTNSLFKAISRPSCYSYASPNFYPANTSPFTYNLTTYSLKL